jgi:hypothetical protein
LRHCQHAGTQSTPVSTESTRRYLVGFRSTICEPWGLCPAQGWWLCKSQKAWDSSTLVYPIHLCIDGDCSVPGATSATVRRVDAVAHHARERIERRVGIRRSTCARAVLYASTALWTRRRHVARHQLCDHRNGTAGTCNRRPRNLLTCLHAADGPALPKRLRAHHLCVCARACVHVPSDDMAQSNKGLHALESWQATILSVIHVRQVRGRPATRAADSASVAFSLIPPRSPLISEIPHFTSGMSPAISRDGSWR